MVLPTAWGKLTQGQLRDVLIMLAKALPIDMVKARLALRWTHTTIVRRMATAQGEQPAWIAIKAEQGGKRLAFRITGEQLTSIYNQLDFIGYPERCGVRLERLASGEQAADAALHGFPLRRYILADRAYSLYLDTHNQGQALRLVRLLYDGATNATPAEQLGAVIWFAYVKRQFARRWNYLYKAPSETDTEEGEPAATAKRTYFDPQAHQDQADAMVRALTGGDITKEPTVFDTDVWRALTELNAKAREAQQLKGKWKD